MMIALTYLTSPRIDRRVNVPLHLQVLAGAARAAVPIDVQHRALASRDDLRSQLAQGGFDLLYLLAHSDGRRGMVASQGGWIDGRRLGEWLPARTERLPRLIFFNTCDAVKSGLVEAALNAGVGTVIAAEREIRIVGMCDYAEALFRRWATDGVPLQGAVQFVNEAFAEKDVRFEVFGDSKIDSMRELFKGTKKVPLG